MTTWLLSTVISGAISLAILVAACGFMWRRGRQPSMGLWGLGWAVYAVHFVTQALGPVSSAPLLWRFLSLASLGLSSFLFYAGASSFAGRPFRPRAYAWGLLPVLWALVVFLDLPFDYRLAGAPIFVFVTVVDLFTAGTLFRHIRIVGRKRAGWSLTLIYGMWAGLKLAQPIILPDGFILVALSLIANGAALSLALFLIAASLIEAEREARRRAERLEALSTLAAAAGRLLSPDELLRAALDELARLLRTDSGLGIFLRDPDEEEPCLRLVVGRGLSANCQESDPEETCACSLTVRTGQMVSPAGPLLPPVPCPPGCSANLAIPLTARGRVLGALCAALPPDYRFTAGERRTLETVGQQLGIALENALLYQETQQRLRELAALHEIETHITSALELEEVLRVVGDQMRRVLDISTLYIGLYEPERDELYLPFIVDQGEERPPARLKVSEGKGLASWVVRTGQPLWIDDMQEEKDRLPVEAVQMGEPTRTIVVLPLFVKERVVGVLSAQSYTSHAFDASQQRLLTDIAHQVAIAIENARLYQMEREARELAERLRETTLLLSSSLDLQEVLELILDQLAQVIPYDSGAIHTLESDATRVIAVRNLPPEEVGRRYPLDQYPYNRRLAQGEGPIVIQDAREDGEGWVAVEGLHHIRANIGVPLWVRDRVIGALTIDSNQPGTYNETDARIVQAFAQQVATAIENARLYTAQQRLAEEASVLLEIADAINSTLEPRHILREVTIRAARACEANRCTIFLLDERGEMLLPIMSQFASGRLDREMWSRFQDASYSQRVEDVLEALQVIRTRRPLFVPDAQASSLPRQWMKYLDVGSLLIVPLVSREQVIGLMGFDRPEVGRPFTPEQVNLAMTIGAQAAVAIENARLYQETARRLAQTQALREVMLAAASTLDFDQVLERTIETLRATMGVGFISFVLPDEQGEGLRPHPSQIGYSLRVEQIRLPLDGSICGQVFRTGEPMLVGDVQGVSYYYEVNAEVRSELAVPVRVGGRVSGVLNVESARSNAFDEEDLDFYMAIAGQLGLTLENARLYQQEQQHRREAETLYRAAQALTTTLDLQEVFDRILTELQQVVPYDSASVQLLEQGVFKIIGGRGFPNLEELLGLTIDPNREDNPNGQVVMTRAPVILEDAPASYAEFRREPHIATRIRAWIGVPLLFGDRVIGLLSLDKREPGFYTLEHAHLALAFAGQAAIAIENARLYQRLEEQSARLRQVVLELQELNRLRDQVVQNVSHELRTPLTLIRGYAELLLNGDLGALSPSQCNALEMIHDRAVILARVIYNLTALQTLAREALVPVPLSLAEVIEQILAGYRRLAARAGVRFEADLPADLPMILGDRERLGLVFLHLVDNAAKFSPHGGTVRIRAWSGDGQVHVAIQDEGIGIAPEHLSRVFERFYQADGSTTRRFSGMGIGLALVWEIVEAHGGTVTVESEPGKGSVFTVSLPQKEESWG